MIKLRRRLSIKQFVRRHPDLELEVHARDGTYVVIARKRNAEATVLATRVYQRLEEAVYELSCACYKLASLDAMERQGWADANTGQTGVPLQAHHVKKRSKGRLDATENLAGVTAETHGFQHERKGR